MSFSTAQFDREAARLREFDGCELRELTAERFAELRHLMGQAKRLFDVEVAQVGAELSRRSAPELGQQGLARREGFTSPGRLFANDLGTSPQEANRLVGAGEVLRNADEERRRSEDVGATGEVPAEQCDDHAERVYPVLAAAILAGQVGSEAAAIVRRTLDGLPSSDLVFEARLVDKATTLILGDLRRAADRLAATRDPGDLAARERRQVDARSLYFTQQADGMTVMHAKLDPASAAPIKTWIDAQVRAAYRSARDGLPEERMPGQIRVDVLAGLAWHGMDCERPTSGVKTRVVLRVDKGDLERGIGIADCDALPQPISIETMRQMAVDAGVVPVTYGGDSLPLDVGREHRLFTPAQRLALGERDGGCAWCHAPISHCEAHHIAWWNRDAGPTDIANGVLLCTGCHHRVHRYGWDITVRDGQVWITPPASVDATRTPRLGGKAHLEIVTAADPPPRELVPSA
ncbi:HNH endonuclease signature motif containing protein [Demequina sp. NBRC 110057]|uniref:HNH endonuclease n=1 Tax=Demequina sp. NBRC 110057 TaxID=1570346 RepID=UPI000A005EC1|nr:HNH endonuclease signature motif containing protein [Demequina sp. NBRC 110057]